MQSFAEDEEEFWQEDIELLPVLQEDIPDYKFRQGKNYNKNYETRAKI